MLTGVILAGGDNQRMQGEHKALLSIGGKPLIVGQIETMKACCDELIVVTNDPLPFLRILDRSVRIITDYYPSGGPLGGMHAGLALANNPSVWVVGCDMPFISGKAAELIWSKQKEGFDAVVAMVRGGIYPLHGVYDRKVEAQIAPLLSEDDKGVSALLRQIRWSAVSDTVLQESGVDPDFVRSIKTPEEYEEIRKLSHIHVPHNVHESKRLEVT